MKNQARRFAKVLLVLLIVAFFAVVMVACSNGETPDSGQNSQGQEEVCNHAFGEWKVVADPTCTKTGLRRETCSLCGQVKEEILDIVAHTPEVRVGTKPTCTEDGSTDETYCSVCGEILQAAEVLFATGHIFENWQTITEPTCEENGMRRGTCIYCKQTLDEPIESLGHDLVHHDGQRATCTELGYRAYDTCSRCDYTTYQETSTPLGHIVVVDEAIVACVGNGWTEGSHCSRCGEVFVERQAVPAVGHNFDIVLNEGHEATCTGEGYSRQVQCSRCYYIEGGVTSPALGHDFDEDEKCRRCGEWKEYNRFKMTLKANGTEYFVERYYNDTTTDIVIPAKFHGLPVTEIGKEAFKGTNITSVHFSNVKMIGQGAFERCSNLHNLAVGEGVERINKCAFNFCQNLQTIALPNSLTVLGDNVFENCSSLTSLTIPKNVAYISSGLLFGCHSITELSVDEANTKYYSQGNCIIDSNSKTLVAGCKTSVIPTDGGVEVIGMDAFEYNRELTSISIPDSVKVIGREAFASCENLVDVTLGSSLERLELGVFWGCQNLESVMLPSSLTYIGGDVFRDTNLKTITIPNGVKTIKDHAFMSCYNLETILVSDNIEKFGVDIFEWCPNLQYNEYDNAKYLGNTEHPYLVLMQATGKDIETCEIAYGCRIICETAFAGCSQMTSVTIPNTVLSIGNDAFNGSNLKTVSIPSSVVDISDLAFSYCGAIKTFLVDENNPNYSSQDGILYNKTKTEFVAIPGALEGSITIPESITSIGGFTLLSNLTNVTLPNNLQSIGSQSFTACFGLQYNEYDNATYLGSDTNPYLVLMRAKDKSITSCVVHENCKFIRGGAFAECSALESISIPSGIVQICDSAFSECLNLQYNVYDNAKYLGNATNPYVVLLEATEKEISSCIVSENCKIIYDSAFKNCEILASIAIPNSVVQIGDSAFKECTSLEDIILGDNVAIIGQDAFYHCQNLTAITLPENLKHIESFAFGWSGLISITIPDSVVSIGIFAFEGCKLTSIQTGHGVKEIQRFTFTGASQNGLETITIEEGVVIIGRYQNAFSGDTDTIYLPSTLKCIENFGPCFNNYTDIVFNGTKEQWFTIEKSGSWDVSAGDCIYTIHCTDGDIAKS